MADQVLWTGSPAMFRNHPLGFVFLWMVLVACVLAGFVVGWQTGFLAAMALAVVFSIPAGLTLLSWWIQKIGTVLTVTESRIIERRGILSRSTNEIRHVDVRNIQVDQSFLQRLLGTGRIRISSAGQDDIEIDVRGISDPEEIATIIRDRQG